jgi:zinc transport system ATP-binding protein
VLLLDEPVAGLDYQSTEKMYEIIENLNKEGVTIIMISHDLVSAIKYASHILHIGKKIFYGTKTEFLNTDIYKETV